MWLTYIAGVQSRLTCCFGFYLILVFHIHTYMLFSVVPKLNKRSVQTGMLPVATPPNSRVALETQVCYEDPGDLQVKAVSNLTD